MFLLLLQFLPVRADDGGDANTCSNLLVFQLFEEAGLCDFSQCSTLKNAISFDCFGVISCLFGREVIYPSPGCATLSQSFKDG